MNEECLYESVESEAGKRPGIRECGCHIPAWEKVFTREKRAGRALVFLRRGRVGFPYPLRPCPGQDDFRDRNR